MPSPRHKPATCKFCRLFPSDNDVSHIILPLGYKKSKKLASKNMCCVSWKSCYTMIQSNLYNGHLRDWGKWPVSWDCIERLWGGKDVKWHLQFFGGCNICIFKKSLLYVAGKHVTQSKHIDKTETRQEQRPARAVWIHYCHLSFYNKKGFLYPPFVRR